MISGLGLDLSISNKALISVAVADRLLRMPRSRARNLPSRRAQGEKLAAIQKVIALLIQLGSNQKTRLCDICSELDMRFSRLVIGVLVIIVSIWVIAAEQMAGASANAVVNAQVVPIRTPIAGRVSDASRVLGSALSAGDALATVLDPAPDAVRLDDLTLQRDLVLSRLQELQAKKTAQEQELALLDQRLARYQDLSVQELTARLAEATERLRLRAEGETAADPIELSFARETAASLQIILAGANEGVFIQGGFNDAPHAEQRASEIRAALLSLEQEILTAQSDHAALNRRIDLERIRLGRASSASVSAPVSGLLWESFVANGSHVERGDVLMRMVDCGNVFVTLSVTQSVFNTLTPGTAASFRFDDSGEVFSGIVSRLGGTSAAGFYGTLAIAPSQKHLERADVLLTLPELANHPELRCAIGRTGRAFFEVRPLDWLRSYFQ